MPTIPEAFVRLAEFLEREKVPFVVIGGIAASLQGLPRFTDDVDVMVGLASGSVRGLAEAARAAGYEVDPDAAAMQWVASGILRMWDGGAESGTAVDLMTGDSDYFRQVIWRAEHTRFCGVRVLVATPEDVILLKAMAWREKDIPDARAVEQRNRDRLDRDYLDEWATWLGANLGTYEAVPERVQAILTNGPAPPANRD